MTRSPKPLRRGLLAAALALAAACPPAWAPAWAYDVREIGSYFVGGHIVAMQGLPTEKVKYYPTAPVVDYDPNGDVATGQMYVQVVRLKSPRGALPIIFIHGGGLSGVSWETTPDGRPGWQQYFLDHGFDTVIPDAVERGRSSWSRWPQIYASAPLFRTGQEGWGLFRLGPRYDSDAARREVWPGEQFPVEAYDMFTRQFNARWTTNDGPTQEAYDALIQRECPCILVVHSQGSSFGIAAALKAPDKVRAVVGLEPSSAPDPATIEVARLKGMPMLFIWGDNIDKDPVWQKRLTNPRKFADAMRGLGNPFDWIDLPERGLRGNSHMLMMDRNTDQIAGLVADWLGAHGFVR